MRELYFCLQAALAAGSLHPCFGEGSEIGANALMQCKHVRSWHAFKNPISCRNLDPRVSSTPQHSTTRCWPRASSPLACLGWRIDTASTAGEDLCSRRRWVPNVKLYA